VNSRVREAARAAHEANRILCLALGDASQTSDSPIITQMLTES